MAQVAARAPGAGRGNGAARQGGGAAPTAATAGEPAPAPNVANVGGTYNITIDVPGQTLTGTLVLRQAGDVITGTMTTQIGVVQIAGGKATAEGFNFAASVDYGGTNIDIVVRGSVSGNNLTATIDSPQGSIPMTGTKVP